jgi:polar amino acid transport system substrate-binding protein
MKTFRIFTIIALVTLVLAACTSPTPQVVVQTAVVTSVVQQTVQVPVQQTVVVNNVITATPVPTVAPTPTAAQPTPVATISPDKLAEKGHLLICTDFPYPPQEFFDENGNPQGLDIDIGTEIANRLGLKVQFVNSMFDSIIEAVSSGKCDIIISAQNITTDRQKQVNMIPYFQAGQAFVVAKGNPKGIKQVLDLCGQSVAAESGTTEADYLQATGDYKGAGLPALCTKATKTPPTVIVTQKDTDALQQLQAGKVVAYATDSPVAAYYTVQHPDQFELAGSIVEAVSEGISVPCGQADCTNVPLTDLGNAISTALKSMMADGTYTKILQKWNLTNSAVTP